MKGFKEAMFLGCCFFFSQKRCKWRAHAQLQKLPDSSLSLVPCRASVFPEPNVGRTITGQEKTNVWSESPENGSSSMKVIFCLV